MVGRQSYVPPENVAINKGNHPEQIAPAVEMNRQPGNVKDVWLHPNRGRAGARERYRGTLSLGCSRGPEGYRSAPAHHSVCSSGSYHLWPQHTFCACRPALGQTAPDVTLLSQGRCCCEGRPHRIGILMAPCWETQRPKLFHARRQ